jgi:hypothetical protein
MAAHKRSNDDSAHDVLAAEAFAVGDADPRLHEEPVHDVLAAEEFAVGSADPELHDEPAHDVLAAEEFAVGAADPDLSHGPVSLPDDPTGIAEPHDVLAAEEFPLPAHPPSPAGPVAGRRPLDYSHLRAAALLAGAFVLLRRIRRR